MLKIYKEIEQIMMQFNNRYMETALQIYVEVKSKCKKGMSLIERMQVLVHYFREKIEFIPEYTYVAAACLLRIIKEEQRQVFEIKDFSDYVRVGLYEDGRLESDVFKKFSWKELELQIKEDRDSLLTYIGLQTLYDRYLLKYKGLCYESPQQLFMRVACGLAYKEEENTKWAITFYDVISSLNYMPATPTLFNAGTIFPQLSSCYISTVDDSIEDIYDLYKENALMSKWAGGIANDWTNVRAAGAVIKGTGGESRGVVPWLKVQDSSTIAVNQGGKRKGAVCAYLEVWHLDIEDFLDLKKNSGDDRRRTHDMNTAIWVPDAFMEAVRNKGDWWLFSPNEAPDLHSSYGKEFNSLYEDYIKLAMEGGMRNYKKVKARILWKKILNSLYETGHPWICFKDAINEGNRQKHWGQIHSSNLCTEITLNTSKDEIAVCNLGSINLVNFVKGKQNFCWEEFINCIELAIRMLDNVIDINYYPVDKAERSNKLHRPIGLGVMGFQDAIYKLDIAHDWEQVKSFNKKLFRNLYSLAKNTSIALGKEKGCYETFEGSYWHEQGFEIMRNSNLIAIAPTVTISNICGVSASIEPLFSNIYVKANLSGNFTTVNKWLIEDLRALGQWNEDMLESIKKGEIPKALREKYKTAFERHPKEIIELAADRQPYICQSQSLNLYVNNTITGKQLSELYFYAFDKKVKTTYYLRTQAANVSQTKSCEIGCESCE